MKKLILFFFLLLACQGQQEKEIGIKSETAKFAELKAQGVQPYFYKIYIERAVLNDNGTWSYAVPECVCAYDTLYGRYLDYPIDGDIPVDKIYKLRCRVKAGILWEDSLGLRHNAYGAWSEWSEDYFTFTRHLQSDPLPKQEKYRFWGCHWKEKADEK